MWDIIRCLFFLWELGIAGEMDISFFNIKVKREMHGEDQLYTILNDFDLAATMMTPGKESPSKLKGFERTGTKPFMAVQLLKVSNGTICWSWRHDFESIAWSLTWCCKKEWDWARYTHSRVAEKKNDWIMECNYSETQPPSDLRPGSEILWGPITLLWQDFTITWWDKRDKTAQHYLNFFNKHFPQPSDFKAWDWMVFAVPPQKTRPQTIDEGDVEASPAPS